jgi:hypothetical protein
MRHDKRRETELFGKKNWSQTLPAPYDPGRFQTNNCYRQVAWLCAVDKLTGLIG